MLKLILSLLLIFNMTTTWADSSGKEIIHNINQLIHSYQSKHQLSTLEQTLHEYIKLSKVSTSYYAYEMLYPLSTKNSKAFALALKKLSPSEQKVIKFNLAEFAREQKKGNDF